MSIEWLSEKLKENNIELSNTQKEQFQTYYQLLVEWNEKMNLTSITDEHEVYLKHFMIQSHQVSIMTLRVHYQYVMWVQVQVSKYSIENHLPELKVTIVDSLNKRIQFLNHLADALGLQDVSFVHDRAETLVRETTESLTISLLPALLRV